MKGAASKFIRWIDGASIVGQTPATAKGLGATARVAELRDLGAHMAAARKRRGLSQVALARKCGLTQGAISAMESGDRRPSLEQFFRVARALDVPLQQLISGKDRPGGELADIAMQLRSLGIVDLWVRDAVVPGAFLRVEEVIAHIMSVGEPDPRVVLAMPAVLAWNEWDFHQLVWSGPAADARLRNRVGWLADLALAIDRRRGFPGGCRREQLSVFVEHFHPHVSKREVWDSLGRLMTGEPRSPIWRRWRINFDAEPGDFEKRAEELVELGGGLRWDLS
jgi:transcriptional regulator with XRE-family HTH domain